MSPRDQSAAAPPAPPRPRRRPGLRLQPAALNGAGVTRGRPPLTSSAPAPAGVTGGHSAVARRFRDRPGTTLENTETPSEEGTRAGGGPPNSQDPRPLCPYPRPSKKVCGPCPQQVPGEARLPMAAPWESSGRCWSWGGSLVAPMVLASLGALAEKEPSLPLTYTPSPSLGSHSGRTTQVSFGTCPRPRDPARGCSAHAHRPSRL